jgi:hypothetical protein
MMTPSQRRVERSQSIRILLALLCVVLVVFIGSAQLLHMHAGPERADSGCSLCAVAHLAALPTPALASLAVAENVQLLRAAEAAVAPPRFPAYSYDSRPPPVVAA